MAHYAFLDANNVVTEVITGVHEDQLVKGKTPEQFYSTFRNQPCVRTSYNGNIRKQYAGIGFTYDEVRDEFVAPQPYASWTLDENNDWQPPTPMPSTGGPYRWSEEDLEWVAI